MIDQSFFFLTGMNRGGWQEGPKRGTRRGKKEYKRLRKLQMMANRAKRIEDEAWELLDHAPEDSAIERYQQSVGAGEAGHSDPMLKKKLKDANNQLDRRKVCIYTIIFILENALTLYVYI